MTIIEGFISVDVKSPIGQMPLKYFALFVESILL
jgi:hypothetical protein